MAPSKKDGKSKQNKTPKDTQKSPEEPSLSQLSQELEKSEEKAYGDRRHRFESLTTKQSSIESVDRFRESS